MGAKYSSNSISGYNSTPPSDDGATSEANKVKWSTIKNKLTDPPKTLAEAINTDINTALDYGPISVVSAAVTLGASHNNQFIEMSGASTPTLGDAATLTAGWFCDVKNTGSNVITMARTTSTDTINTVTADVTMNSLDYIRFVVNAAASGFQTVQVKIATQAQADAGTASDVFITPETLAGRMGLFVNNASGNANISNTQLNITSTVSAVTWESIGPTGSGADHIWAVLDSVPLGADWVELRIYASATDSATAANTVRSATLAARGDGSSEAYGIDTGILTTGYYTNAAGHGHALDYSVTKIPFSSSGVFELYWVSSTEATNIYVWLTGYGYNSV